MPRFQIANSPLLEGQEPTQLTATAASGATTLIVRNINGFSVGQFIAVGTFGEETSEIVRIHTSTAPSGTTITLNSALIFEHAVDTFVTVTGYNQVEFSRATTTTGSKTVIDTKDIEADGLVTTVEDTTNTTGYGFFRFKNNAASTFGSYSGPIPYAGFGLNTVRQMKDSGLGICHESLGGRITEDFLLRELNNWQLVVTSFRNWSWEVASAIDTTVAGQRTYALTTALSDLKKANEGSGIIQMRIKNYPALYPIDKIDWDTYMEDTISTTLASSVALIDTTITLTDSSDFASSGSIEIEGDVINYTSNNTSTNVLSGVTGITATHASGVNVWQSTSVGLPTYWAIYNDVFMLYPIVSSTYNSLNIYIDYYRQATQLINDTDATTIPFYYSAQYFLAWKIQLEKGDPQKQAEYYRQLFNDALVNEARKDQPPVKAGFKVVF